VKRDLSCEREKGTRVQLGITIRTAVSRVVVRRDRQKHGGVKSLLRGPDRKGAIASLGKTSRTILYSKRP